MFISMASKYVSYTFPNFTYLLRVELNHAVTFGTSGDELSQSQFRCLNSICSDDLALFPTATDRCRARQHQ